MSAYQFDPLTWPRWSQMWALAITIYIDCNGSIPAELAA
jgi:hypothetical protein